MFLTLFKATSLFEALWSDSQMAAACLLPAVLTSDWSVPHQADSLVFLAFHWLLLVTCNVNELWWPLYHRYAWRWIFCSSQNAKGLKSTGGNLMSPDPSQTLDARKFKILNVKDFISAKTESKQSVEPDELYMVKCEGQCYQSEAPDVLHIVLNQPGDIQSPEITGTIGISPAHRWTDLQVTNTLQRFRADWTDPGSVKMFNMVRTSWWILTSLSTSCSAELPSRCLGRCSAGYLLERYHEGHFIMFSLELWCSIRTFMYFCNVSVSFCGINNWKFTEPHRRTGTTLSRYFWGPAVTAGWAVITWDPPETERRLQTDLWPLRAWWQVKVQTDQSTRSVTMFGQFPPQFDAGLDLPSHTQWM